ncbi:MAG: ATP-binding cassette domain-containing protein [Desulfobacterales bacterium]
MDRVVETFHLASLLTTHLIKLSNGETKRLRMAAALLKNPKILLLDNPLNGLDVATREGFEDIFAEIAASGTTIIMATALRDSRDHYPCGGAAQRQTINCHAPAPVCS